MTERSPMSRDDDDLPDATALVASLLSLMTRFARLPCPRQAVLVERQLAYLQSYPDALMPTPLKAVAQRLRGEWQCLLCERVPHEAERRGESTCAALH